MSDLFKFAYARGAQNALVSAGALGEYPSVESADAAAKFAAYRISVDPLTDKVADEDIAQAMSDLVEAGNGETDDVLAAGAQVNPAAAAAVAGDLKEALIESGEASIEAGQKQLEVADQLPEASVQEAMEVVASLKKAMDASAIGGANADDKEDDGRPEGYANQAPETEHKAPFTGEKKDIDPKTAAAILRKIAEGSDASAIGGANADDKEDDGRPEGYAAQEPDAEHKAPFTGEKKDVSSEIEVTAAYKAVLAKTAGEVGHKLPSELSSTDKLAAIRAMMGMSKAEKVAYLTRINEAILSKHAEKDEDEDEDAKDEKSKKDEDEKSKKDDDSDTSEEALGELAAEFEAAEEEAEEKSAAVLRALGLGR